MPLSPVLVLHNRNHSSSIVIRCRLPEPKESCYNLWRSYIEERSLASSLRVSPHQNVWRIPPKRNCLIYSPWLRLAPFLPRWGPRVVSILPNQTVTYQWKNQEKTNNIVRLKQTFQQNRSDPFASRPKFWLLLSKEGFFSDWTDQSKTSTTSGGEQLWPENFHTEGIVPFINFSTKISGTFLLLGTEIREFFLLVESEILGFGIRNSAQGILSEWKATPDFLSCLLSYL